MIKRTPIAMPNDTSQHTYAVLRKIRFFQVFGVVFRIDHLMKNQKLKRKVIKKLVTTSLQITVTQKRQATQCRLYFTTLQLRHRKIGEH